MVHALEMIHALLKEGGMLVDIHPSDQPPPVELVVGEQRHFLGNMDETDDFIEYVQADLALAEAIQKGLFVWERQGSFTYSISTATVSELKEFLIEEWKDAVLPPEIDAREAELLSWYSGRNNPAVPGIVLTEHVRVARLRGLPREYSPASP